MSFNFTIGDIKDFPHGTAQHGGWFCRSCGNNIAIGDEIFKPKNAWVCRSCFDAGRYDANPNASSKNRYSSQQSGYGGAQPSSQTKSDIEMVDEDNWIEIIFDIIPDRHLKRVYAALSKIYHSDVGGDDETMIRIISAYQGRIKE